MDKATIAEIIRSTGGQNDPAVRAAKFLVSPIMCDGEGPCPIGLFDPNNLELTIPPTASHDTVLHELGHLEGYYHHGNLSESYADSFMEHYSPTARARPRPRLESCPSCVQRTAKRNPVYALSDWGVTDFQVIPPLGGSILVGYGIEVWVAGQVNDIYAGQYDAWQIAAAVVLFDESGNFLTKAAGVVKSKNYFYQPTLNLRDNAFNTHMTFNLGPMPNHKVTVQAGLFACHDDRPDFDWNAWGSGTSAWDKLTGAETELIPFTSGGGGNGIYKTIATATSFEQLQTMLANKDIPPGEKVRFTITLGAPLAKAFDLAGAEQILQAMGKMPNGFQLFDARSEGWYTVILEAKAIGAPVVAMIFAAAAIVTATALLVTVIKVDATGLTDIAKKASETAKWLAIGAVGVGAVVIVGTAISQSQKAKLLSGR